MNVSDEVFTTIQKLLESGRDKVPATAGLRVYVQGGGCGGLQYGFEIAAAPEDDDEVIVKDGARLFIDPMSNAYLESSTLNYISDLSGEGFSVDNPNVKSTCGCGSSFSI